MVNKKITPQPKLPVKPQRGITLLQYRPVQKGWYEVLALSGTSLTGEIAMEGYVGKTGLRELMRHTKEYGGEIKRYTSKLSVEFVPSFQRIRDLEKENGRLKDIIRSVRQQVRRLK